MSLGGNIKKKREVLMPVIDETKHTLEIKAAKKDFQERIDALQKRVEALEKASKPK
jgi:hypothetical protein